MVGGALAPGAEPALVEGPFSTSRPSSKRRASDPGEAEDDDLGVGRAPLHTGWGCHCLRGGPAGGAASWWRLEGGEVLAACLPASAGRWPWRATCLCATGPRVTAAGAHRGNASPLTSPPTPRPTRQDIEAQLAKVKWQELQVLQQYAAPYGATSSGPYGVQPFRLQVSPLALSMMDMHAHMDRWVAAEQAAALLGGPSSRPPPPGRCQWRHAPARPVGAWGAAPPAARQRTLGQPGSIEGPLWERGPCRPRRPQARGGGPAGRHVGRGGEAAAGGARAAGA
jgi:hypothetical protein